MIFLGQFDGRQTGKPNLRCMAIKLPISKSTRSHANSSRIKSYDCLKLTLLFQSRNDSIKDQKRVLDQNQLKRMHLNQGTYTRLLKLGACVKSCARIQDARIGACARIPGLRIRRASLRASLARASDAHLSARPCARHSVVRACVAAVFTRAYEDARIPARPSSRASPARV